jgi:hypothetical protein
MGHFMKVIGKMESQMVLGHSKKMEKFMKDKFAMERRKAMGK